MLSEKGPTDRERLATIDLLCRNLRGEPVGSPEPVEFAAADAFEIAQSEGVHLLIAHRLRQGGAIALRPRGLDARFDMALRDEVAIEQITRRELREVIATLHADGVSPLIFKGAALAFTHYPDPALRPRVDVDLLVGPGDVRATTRVFERMGYRRSLSVTGELVGSEGPNFESNGYLVSSQIPYEKTDRYGVHHAFDVHWKTSIPRVFANLLTFEELISGSVPIALLGDAAAAIGPVHALAIACIHRVAHHHDNDHLIWLYDIHLLAGALGPAEAEKFLRLAHRTRLIAVCEQALSLAQQKFGTRLPAGLLETFRGIKFRHDREVSAAYLRPNIRKVDILLSDLAALESWRQRLQLLKEHVFPPASYMQNVYGVSGRSLLPVLYVWRVMEGVGGWFRKGSARN
jgi:hypothetical protein